MIKSKIDQNLFYIVSLLDEDKKWECIVHANDFSRTKNILKQKKIEILNEYLFIKSFRVKACKRDIEYLSKTTQVKYISSVSKASMQMQVAKEILGIKDFLCDGEGVTIAFIDTGIVCHADFCLGKNRILKFIDFVGEKEKPYDDNGHGTFVAGVCSGNGSMSAGRYSGIAPKSNIISLKALNGKGEASADKILNAMEWVYNNHDKYNIKVVCMSFGSEPLGFNDPIMKGAEALWNEGVVVVAAAGNSGPEYNTIKSPGVSKFIITVGGFNDNRISPKEYNESYFEIADFSSRGPAFQRFKPDVVAPSVDIISCGIKETYTSLSGTSVATPMIAGLSALILQQNPILTPLDVKRALLSSCRPICLNRNFEGYGYPLLKNLFKNG